MANPVTWPSARKFVGTAKEVTQGTAVVPITFTHPLMVFDPEDKPVWLDDEAARGSMVQTYGRVQGVISADHNIGGPLYCDGMGFWLNNLLGDLTTTPGTPNLHAFSVLNTGSGQPGSLTVADWQGPPATSQTRLWPGFCLSEIGIKANAASTFIEWSGKALGWKSSIAGAAQTSAPTAIPALAGWRYQLGIAGPASGGTQIKYSDEFECTITRKVKANFTGQNSQDPYFIQRDTIDVTGSIHFSKPPDEAVLLPLLNNSQPQVQFLATNGGVGAGLLSVQIDMQVCAWDTSKIERGDEAVGYAVGFKAIANSTNAGASGGVSPIKVSLQNSVAGASY